MGMNITFRNEPKLRKEFCMSKKRLFGMLILIVGVMLAFCLIGCDNDNNGNGDNGDNGGNGGNGGSTSIGCSSLSAGTKCAAHSSCSNHFLCLTGQGSDNNCTTGCSCQ